MVVAEAWLGIEETAVRQMPVGLHARAGSSPARSARGRSRASRTVAELADASRADVSPRNRCRAMRAVVAELADAPGSEPGGRKTVQVQILPTAVRDECRWNYMDSNPAVVGSNPTRPVGKKCFGPVAQVDRARKRFAKTSSSRLNLLAGHVPASRRMLKELHGIPKLRVRVPPPGNGRRLIGRALGVGFFETLSPLILPELKAAHRRTK
jgi:hypothetical protein